MNIKYRTLLLLSLADGIGKMLIEQGETPEIKWRALKMQESASRILVTQKTKITKPGMRLIRSKIDAFCKDKHQFDLVEALSFLILGISDLMVYKRSNGPLYTPLLKRIVWFTKLFDTKLDEEETHTRAMGRYEQWIA